jgi:acetolactate synthase I/II/III large subunit
MTGNRFFAEAMRGYGVTHLFFVPSVAGGAMAEMDSVGVTKVITHGEKAAAYMADGYARASHRPGICLCQDIGTTNLAAGLRDAWMACVPVIAVSGGQSDKARYRHAYQNAEDFPAWDRLTKANFSVDSVERFPDLLRQAFRVATTGSPGPVHLELRGNAGQMLDREADFALTFEDQYATYPAFRPGPESEAVRAAVQALSQADKPIIVAGGGTVASGASAEVVELAERLSIPIATSLHAKAIVPDEHPLAVGVAGSYSRWCANKAVAAADLICFVGSHTGGQVTNAWEVPKQGTATIQIDIDPSELGRNYPNTVSLLGDARTVLRRMLEVAEQQPPREEWLKETRGYVREYWLESESFLNSNAVPIRPERICKELTEWLPARSVLVADTFHAAIWTAQMVRLNKPEQRYIRCAGSLGWGFPATLGVKAALPDTPIIGFVGDAGFYYHIAELETAARMNLNAVMIVNNNYSGGVSETSRFDTSVNFARVAEGLGCFGIRVERPDEIQPALDRAIASGRPAVVEVLTEFGARAKRGWSPEGEAAGH